MSALSPHDASDICKEVSIIICTSVPIHATLYLRKVTTGEPKSLSIQSSLTVGPEPRGVVYQSISHLTSTHPHIHTSTLAMRRKEETRKDHVPNRGKGVFDSFTFFHRSSMLMVRGVVCTQRHKVSDCHRGAPLAYSPPSPTFHFSFLLTC